MFRCNVAALAVFVLAGQVYAAVEPEKSVESGRPKIEVVFVLDTTGSMGGLIEGAKQKIWAIANAMATAKPTPDIRMGLVGYRDRGDDYVVTRADLTDDLDAVYARLMAFQANGGGDGPESVNQALHEAVTAIKWSGEKNVYRVIFLVGDFPPHMDYQNDVKYPETCKRAITRGIVINTIQCGNHPPTEPIWQEIARKAEGRYFRVEQTGGAVVIPTPFDAELAELSQELDATRVFYGSAEVLETQLRRAETADKIVAEASMPAQAERAVFNSSAAGSANFLGLQELISDVMEGRVKLADIKDEELPESMRTMSPAEQARFVDERATKRAQLQERIGELSLQRNAHVQQQISEQDAGDRTGFDAAMVECIREQAGKQGMILTD